MKVTSFVGRMPSEGVPKQELELIIPDVNSPIGVFAIMA